MKKIVKWLDPKLEKFREPRIPKKEVFIPKTTEELIQVIGRTPKDILSSSDKNIIAAGMSLKNMRVSDLMIPKNEATFVNESDFLGPLTLDKLYQSGFSHFPVKDKMGRIVGTIDTEALNSLEVKDGKKAKDFLSKTPIVFVKEKQKIQDIIDEFLRTNAVFFVVTNSAGENVGILTFEMVIYFLLGKL